MYKVQPIYELNYNYTILIIYTGISIILIVLNADTRLFMTWI